MIVSHHLREIRIVEVCFPEKWIARENLRDIAETGLLSWQVRQVGHVVALQSDDIPYVPADNSEIDKIPHLVVLKVIGEVDLHSQLLEIWEIVIGEDIMRIQRSDRESLELWYFVVRKVPALENHIISDAWELVVTEHNQICIWFTLDLPVLSSVRLTSWFLVMFSRRRLFAELHMWYWGQDFPRKPLHCPKISAKYCYKVQAFWWWGPANLVGVRYWTWRRSW